MAEGRVPRLMPIASPLLGSSAYRTPGPAVLFYTADATAAASEVARLTAAAGFVPVRTGGVSGREVLEFGTVRPGFKSRAPDHVLNSKLLP